MDSLKTDILGGFPWVLDDFRWHHDATREAITEIVHGLNLEGLNCKLQGVIPTFNGVTYDITAGYLFVDGEIVKYDAQNGLATPAGGGFDYYFVTISETFDAAGNKALEDGGTADAYKVRRAVVNEGGIFPVGGDLVFDVKEGADDFPTLPSVINRVLGFSDAWNLVSAATLDALAHTGLDAVVSGAIRWKKAGRVMFTEWDLIIDFDATVASFEITLPPDLIPQQAAQNYTLAILESAGGVYPKIAKVNHFAGGLMTFQAINNDYTFEGATATLQFALTYQVPD